jgi:Peptidase family M1 domain/Peptidase M1 N-terminal domain
MSRRFAVIAAVTLGLLLAAPGGAAAQFGPGAPGIGDPYFPLDGNGGYDVRHYRLDVAYDPPTDLLRGVATIRARAKQDLSALNLDLSGLTVRSVAIDGRAATWSRAGSELTITPRRGLAEGSRFVVVVTYDGVPQSVDPESPFGFVHTDDGTKVAGAPHVAATWFPVNDHPRDKASYTLAITAPAGLEPIGNGVLVRTRTRRGLTTWVWRAREPMAPYLTTATIGEFDVRAYRADGVRYVDAVDPDIHTPPTVPRSGERYAIAQAAQGAFKRLTRTIAVPAAGGELSFWAARDTEPAFDFFFVEARPAGSDAWTTLPDRTGHTSDDTGGACPYWLELHPFLAHYQTATGEETCDPAGATGTWSAASGASEGYEQWTVDLSAYAGTDVEISLTYASDDFNQARGVFVDDIVVPGGDGSTSFEDDGDALDGWTVPGPPAGSPPNANDWIAGTVADAPPTTGETVDRALGRQPEFVSFLSSLFGPYPFTAAGAIVDDDAEGAAGLEIQTRPVYAASLFTDPTVPPDEIVVHELAHQWVGDSVAVANWRDIWLSEGFATYAQWLWNEHEGIATAQEQFDSYAAIPADDEFFWPVVIGDPGPDRLLHAAVYFRGAMTLHALRGAIGDRPFLRLLRRWAQGRAGGNGSIGEFTALAERISGEQLDAFFETWLYTPEKPPGLESAAHERTGVTGNVDGVLLERLERRHVQRALVR